MVVSTRATQYDPTSSYYKYCRVTPLLFYFCKLVEHLSYTIMSSTFNEPADSLAKGIIPTAKQNFGDVWRWS